MLIIVPPSETKRSASGGGPPLALDRLSFRELTPIRERVIAALVETSASPDAFRRLHVRPTMAEEVARNTALRELATMPAASVYSGPLHRGLSIATLSPSARDRAERSIVITSPLFGLLRLSDAIPPYRLNLFSFLLGLPRLDAVWKPVLPDVLASAGARESLVLDLRSPEAQLIGRPEGRADTTVSLKVRQQVFGRFIGDVVAKRVRGEAGRLVLEAPSQPAGVDELAAMLEERWPVELSSGPRGALTLTLRVED
ncbi:MAG TPA: peroxide stress protein YaaA [Candidatus Limnocylindrales bacterium]